MFLTAESEEKVEPCIEGERIQTWNGFKSDSAIDFLIVLIQSVLVLVVTFIRPMSILENPKGSLILGSMCEEDS